MILESASLLKRLFYFSAVLIVFFLICFMAIYFFYKKKEHILWLNSYLYSRIIFIFIVIFYIDFVKRKGKMSISPVTENNFFLNMIIVEYSIKFRSRLYRWENICSWFSFSSFRFRSWTYVKWNISKTKCSFF